MDYNSKKVSKIINLYLMLAYNDVSYIRIETGKFLKNYLLPELGDEDYEDSDVSDTTRELSRDCQSIADEAASPKGNKKRFDIIFKEISSTADDVSNYNDKPLVSELVCIWYIFSCGQNDYQGKVIDLLRKKWKIKDDILAEMADTCATLAELKENSQKIVGYMPKKSFFLPIRNLFRKNKVPDKKQLFEDEYRNDEKVLLQSIKELFATEAVRD